MSKSHFVCGGTIMAEAVRALYRQGQTDYSLEPIILTDANGKALGRITDGDSVIFCCRRGEREIQLTEAFTESSFRSFTRPYFQDLHFVILTLYHEKFKDLPVAFAPTKVVTTLGEIVSRAGMRQLRIAESEKFSHVTFFFNGGNNQPFTGEDDMRIPSPQGISYDQVPELSLAQVTQQVLDGIAKRYDLIITNFANGDVIGHTSNNEAKVKCAELVDARLGQVVETAAAAGYVVIVTADHGNLEVMTNPDGLPHVAHTANPVPLVLIDPRSTSTVSQKDGKLADVAPIILSALGLTQPIVMDAQTLARDHDWGGRRRVMLVILDGWGIGKKDDTNPIFLARTPVWDGLVKRYPYHELQAAGRAVGLEDGKAGNSEAGHMNLGAGRVILQDDVRLEAAMQDGSFYTNHILCAAINRARQRKTGLHLLALLTEKSSHGSIDYPLALLKMAKASGLKDVFVHIIFDGRSTEPGSAPALLEKLEHQMDEIGIGQIVSGMGRSLALDRDGNYDRTKRAFDALVSGIGRICS